LNCKIENLYIFGLGLSNSESIENQIMTIFSINETNDPPKIYNLLSLCKKNNHYPEYFFFPKTKNNQIDFSYKTSVSELSIQLFPISFYGMSNEDLFSWSEEE